MAMEPIGSIMSVQAQSVAPKPVQTQTSEKAGSDTQAVEVQAVEMVESTAKAMENSQKKGDMNQDSEQRQETADPEKLKKAVEKLNKSIENSEAIYGIHEGTNRVTIKIVDKNTKEVIKELPPEKTLDMIAKAWEMAGILVDEKR